MNTADCCADTVGGGLLRRPDADAIRRAGFDALCAGAPYRVNEFAAATGMSTTKVRAIVKELTEAGLVTVDAVMDADPLVDGVDGLTVRPTRHRLTLGDQPLYTWCGFDTIGIPAALGVDAHMETRCPSCDEPITLHVRGGIPPATSVVGWWPYRVDGPVNETFCPTASLFCNRGHLADWRTNAPGPGEVVSAAELADRGRATWALFTERQEHA